MWRINKMNGGGFALLIVLFVVLPLLNVYSAIDPDLNPRLIAISVFCVISFFSLLRTKVQLPDSYRLIGSASIAILFISLLSVFLSINPGDAFAEWLRLFVIYSFALLAVVLLQRSNIDDIVIFRFISIAVLLFCSVAIFQTVPIVEALLDHKKIRISSELASTLSNKNFFSEVLVLLLPVSLLGVLRDERKFKPLHLIAFLLAVFYILLLASIACWLATFVSLLVVVVLLLISRSSVIKFSKKIVAAFAVVAFLLIATGIVVFQKIPIGKSLKVKTEMLSKYISNPSLLEQNETANNNSVFDRLLMIRNSLKMIADHPVTGAGLNNWKLLYTSYGIGGTEVINSGAMNFEHPHNDYLLIWSEQGIFGLIAYLSFFFFVFKFWRNRWKELQSSDRSLLLMILFSIVAFLVISFFSYPRSRIYTPLVLMFFVAYLFKTETNGKTFTLRPLIIILTASICLISVIVTSIRLKSEIHMKVLIASKMKKNFARVIRESERIDQFFYPIDFTATSVNWYRGMALFYSGRIQDALIEYQLAIRQTPFHLRTLNDLATTYEQTGMPDSAIAYYKKALSISPFLTDSRLNLSATYFNQNKIDSAYETINQLNYSKLNIGPQENYVTFMSAILTAKVLDSLNVSTDTILINKMTIFVNDIPRTKKYIRAYKGKTIWPDVFTDNQ